LAFFFHEPLRVVAEVKDRIDQVMNLDPGSSQPGRREWARVLGALAEIDVIWPIIPRLLKLKEIT